jgi:hypothetical protein
VDLMVGGEELCREQLGLRNCGQYGLRERLAKLAKNLASSKESMSGSFSLIMSPKTMSSLVDLYL